jgi:hypothetical protein
LAAPARTHPITHYRLDPAKLRQLTEHQKTLSAEIGALMQRRYTLPPDRPRWRRRDAKRLDQLIRQRVEIDKALRRAG